MVQTDRKLDRGIQKEGCKLLCHVRIAEIETGKLLEPEQLNALYRKYKENKWILGICSIDKPSEIMADLVKELGGNSAPRQIGGIVSGRVSFWWSKAQAWSYVIRCYHTANGKHWVLLDRDMNEIYDSYDRPYERRGIYRHNLVG